MPGHIEFMLKGRRIATARTFSMHDHLLVLRNAKLWDTTPVERNLPSGRVAAFGGKGGSVTYGCYAFRRDRRRRVRRATRGGL